MGMHHGIIAFDGPAEKFIEAINTRVSNLVAGSESASLEAMDLEPKDEGWPMAFGELDSKTYLLDTSLVLSGDFDLIAALSGELNATVAGAGAETTSGTYWFIGARNGEVFRSHWGSHTDMTSPWDDGEPLPTEERQPLEDIDGVGLISALGGLGFDYERWVASGSHREVFYAAESFPKSGALGKALKAYRESVKIPEGAQPKPTVLVRSDGGFDIVPGKTKKGLFGFLRRGG